MSLTTFYTDYKTTSISKSSYLRGRIGWQGLKASEFIEEGPYLITGTDFKSGKIDWENCYHVTEERYAEAEYIHVRNGDILITKDGTIGKVVFVKDCPPKAVLNSGIFLLRCKDGSYDHRFMFHLLNSHIFVKFLDDNLAGSTIQHLYQHIFERFEFPIPVIKEQTQIATILSTIDRAIEQTDKLIAKQQRIKTGLMQDLLTKGIDENGNIRSEETHKFKDSVLGRIPVEWEVNTLEDACSLIKDGTHLPPKRVNNGPWLLGVQNIVNDEFVLTFQDTKIPWDFFYHMHNDWQIQPSDVLLAIVGATIGKVTQVPNEFPCFTLQRSVCVLRGKNRYLDNSFLRIWIQDKRFQNQIWDQVNQTAQPGVYLSQLATCYIAIPCYQEKLKIVKTMLSVESFLRALAKEKEKLKVTKTGLMQDLLTGKVRVTELLKEKK